MRIGFAFEDHVSHRGILQIHGALLLLFELLPESILLLDSRQIGCLEGPQRLADFAGESLPQLVEPCARLLDGGVGRLELGGKDDVIRFQLADLLPDTNQQISVSGQRHHQAPMPGLRGSRPQVRSRRQHVPAESVLLLAKPAGDGNVAGQ